MKVQSSKHLKRYNYLASEIDVAYHEISQKLGIADSVSILLYTICDLGDPCPLKNICRSSGISKQTVNSALRKLETEGILYLEPDGRKNKIVCLTEKGRALADRTAGKIMEIENDIFSSWPTEDAEKYLELAERYLHDFKKRSQEI